MDVSEWELSKENVLPLAHGRKVEELNAALQSTDDFSQKLTEEKKYFETQLRIYTGDDPLDPWFKYIKWQEKNFPKGGKELANLLSGCLKALEKKTSKYKDDTRFLEICLKYIQSAPEPLTMFEYMYSNEIGKDKAEFYETWAGEYERMGNTKKANAVFLKGIKVGAEPMESLQANYKHFQARVAKKVMQEDPEEVEYVEPRTVLGGLKGHGKKHVVGSIRTGVSKLHQRQGVGQPHSSRPNAKITVYQDENSEESPEVEMPPMKEWFYSAVPTFDRLIKENEQKPGKWSMYKAKQRRMKPVEFGEVNSGHQQPFHVYMDEDQGASAATSQGTTSALQTRKDKDDFWCPRAYFEPIDEKKQYTVAMMKIYAGNEEFSVEEIQAARYFELKRKCEEAASIQAQHAKLQQMKEEMAAEHMVREKLMQRITAEKDMLERLQRELQHQAEVPPQQLAMKYLSMASNSVDTQQPKKQSLVSMLDDIPQAKSGMQQQQLRSPMKGLPLSPKLDDNRQALTGAVTDPFMVPNPIPQPKRQAVSGRRSSFACLNATANTKEALKVISDMWGASFMIGSMDSELSSPNIPAAAAFSVYQDDTAMVQEDQENIPVQVYCDSPDNEVPVKLAVMDVCIEKPEPMDANDEDKENCKPPGYVQLKEKRDLAGILQESTTIPQAPLADQEEMDSGEDDQDVLETRHLSFTMADPSTRTFPMGQFVSSTPFHSAEKDSSQKVVPATVPLTLPTPAAPAPPAPPAPPGPPPATHPELSMILEESEYKSSSSSGSSCQHSSTHGSSHWSRSAHVSSAHVSSAQMSQVADLSARGRLAERLARVSLGPFPGTANPFDEDLIEALLSKVEPGVEERDGYFYIDVPMPSIREGTELNIGGVDCSVQRKFATGAYAKVFCGVVGGKSVALKVQKPACEWEMYICDELSKRLDTSFLKAAVVDVLQGVIFNNGSVLATTFHPKGTLLDVINQYRQMSVPVPEGLAMYFAFEMLHIIRGVHRCGIIHADVKPDNWLLQAVPEVTSTDPHDVFHPGRPCLKLIDFGRSIDMRLFPSGTTFTKAVTTDQFVCPEMIDGQPWTYQTDLFGIASTVHCLLFGEYLKFSKVNGRNKIKSSLKRWWQRGMWSEFFDIMLNVPSCETIPNTEKLEEAIRDAFVESGCFMDFKRDMTRLGTNLAK